MLKSLRIANIVLIENAEIPFDKGFNVITGETGAGKSAVIQSLNYIVGARSDITALRHGEERGFVEAIFEIDENENVKNILQDTGIIHEKEEELIIRRELSLRGKNRAFINHQQVNTHLLKTLGKHLFEIVGQHANRRLVNIEEHREILDLFGNCLEIKKKFQHSFEQESKLKKELYDLENNEVERIKSIEIYRNQIEELDAADIKEEEDENLFAEYSRLVNCEEISRNASDIYNTLIGGDQPILPSLQQIQSNFSTLLKFDPSLKSTTDTYRSAVLEIEEIVHTIRHLQAKIEFDPDKITKINKRLGVIDKIKRKYGSTIAEITRYYQETIEKLKLLENAENQIDHLKKNIYDVEKGTQKLAEELKEKRVEAAKKIETGMNQQLQALNMSKASFTVSIKSEKRSSHGDETIEFFFLPNAGEKRIAIRDSASGGELSRIMLALQTLLAGKEKIPTLIFDEIDANIGGETACVIGEKLCEIGASHQVLCITHFPQVAKCAKHHIQISKYERKGRTFTETTLLNKEARDKEFARMAGIANYAK